MERPFLKYDKQIDRLIERGLSIKEDEKINVERILKTENYYNVINGYKCIFLDEGKTEEALDDRYKEGSRFTEIYEVFLFDRELRNLFLRSLLIFESHFKSIVAYRFSETYREADAYFAEENFIKDMNSRAEVKKLISITGDIINDKKNKEGHSIKHYYDKPGKNVPLWVLVNDYTFGNISMFYTLLEAKLKNNIAREFSNLYKDEYSINIRITPKMLSSISKTATHFRNCCAHEMTLYNSSLNQRAAVSAISEELDVDAKYLQKNGLFSMYIQLKAVLPKQEFSKLKIGMMTLLRELEESINSDAYRTITGIMGFSKDWDTII